MIRQIFVENMIGKPSTAFFLGLTSLKRQSVHEISSLKVTNSIVNDYNISGVADEVEEIFNADPKENLLGPPKSLESLKSNESIIARNSFSGNITIQRLSRDPDIFLLKSVLSPDVTSSINFFAQEQGLQIAGTRKSDENSNRKNSHLTWLDKIDATSDQYFEIVQSMEDFAETFVHEALRSQSDLYDLESLQVAKYDQEGKFDIHHDDYGRFATVLYYLNGVGGTYFPYAQTREKGDHVSLQNLDIEKTHIPGRDGLLIVGNEDPMHYLRSKLSDEELDSASIAYIEAGDAVLFYNYRPGEKIENSLHGSLPVPCEKWIATNWIRSEKLTGSFGHLYADQILSEELGL